jgi:hypothetical protein
MNINEINNFDTNNLNYNNWNRVYNWVGILLNNNNNNNDIINFNAIQENFDILEQNQLFEVGDFIGIHNYLNTGPNNWNILPNNTKLLTLDIYKELALLMWH